MLYVMRRPVQASAIRAVPSITQMAADGIPMAEAPALVNYLRSGPSPVAAAILIVPTGYDVLTTLYHHREAVGVFFGCRMQEQCFIHLQVENDRDIGRALIFLEEEPSVRGKVDLLLQDGSIMRARVQ